VQKFAASEVKKEIGRGEGVARLKQEVSQKSEGRVMGNVIQRFNRVETPKED